MSLSSRLLRAWYRDHPALRLLRPLELLYCQFARRKRRRFLDGELNTFVSPVPVLIVGNLTVGGTGKTPMILWLVDHCRARGLRVGIVSRGYGAKPPEFPWQVTADQSPAVVGDEPLMIAQRTGAPIMIDPNRPDAVKALLKAEQLDLILSDDGLQHYALARDLELVMVDAVRGFGNRHCLPAGPLREPIERIQSVDAVLQTGARADTEDGYAVQLKPSTLVNLVSGERRPLNYFSPGQEVHAVAGIGNPQRFFTTLETLHWRPVAHAFPDHAIYTAEQLRFQPAWPVVMTEKDAVKCREFATPDWWYLAIEAQPSSAFVSWLDTWLDGLLPH
ncbi:lipid-A-disaccharide kinase [Pseudomonas duriflava]|uniref:Tetraacyldisaccharide 4'-kinase n=1 Tax=Pseudomonas duriflava TaxID=459528 RepID=A0A562Q9L7_9PSED|nr:tetraacyldisaccharide 4'-kinase [Pseudomonas duriflava]TWI53409.1 lipid-A-disaccharide kinase [Pseudomonas duriflava]